MGEREAARRLLISTVAESRLAGRVKRGASIQPAASPRKSGRSKLVPVYESLIELITHVPDITLSELRDALEHAHGVRLQFRGWIKRSAQGGPIVPWVIKGAMDGDAWVTHNLKVLVTEREPGNQLSTIAQSFERIAFAGL